MAIGGDANMTRMVMKPILRPVVAIGGDANTTRTATKPTPRTVMEPSWEPNVAPAQVRSSK